MGEGRGGIHHQQQAERLVGRLIPMAGLMLWMEWEKETWAWWPPYADHNQAKVEASEALSALCQFDSLEPSAVVVRRFNNSPYLPWGSFWFPLPRHDHSLQGFFIHQIPTGPAMPMQATPLLWHQGGLATGGGRGRVRGTSLLPGDLVENVLRKSIAYLTAILLLVCSSPPSPLSRGLPDWGRIWLPSWL